MITVWFSPGTQGWRIKGEKFSQMRSRWNRLGSDTLNLKEWLAQHDVKNVGDYQNVFDITDPETEVLFRLRWL